MALIGMAFFIFVVLLGFLINQKSGADVEAERERVTARALAQAKEALIAYASDRPLETDPGTRPGDLLCPDMDNDGEAESNCGNVDGTTQQENRLGRLPWKTLSIPDLRDGYGERLWYAVSNNFKNSTKRLPLNSDTPGTITLRSSSGAIMFDASTENGVVAVIISAGPALQRQGVGTAQMRTCDRLGVADSDCLTDDSCTNPDPRHTNKCNSLNYLDALSGVEDNAQFIDGSGVDGFINGPIKDASGNFIVNDRILPITVDNIMLPVEKRVLLEVRVCLNAYAAITSNNSRYPWASASYPSYSDTTNQRFGRIPDEPFNNTRTSSSSTMSDFWAPGCPFSSSSNWWHTNNWKEVIFYGVASAFEPASTVATSCGSCLQVSPPIAVNKKFVAIAAGRKLSGQNRASNPDRGTISNYLELQNSTPSDNIFQQGSATTTFNDKVMY
jgi:hypothetical protein